MRPEVVQLAIQLFTAEQLEFGLAPPPPRSVRESLEASDPGPILGAPGIRSRSASQSSLRQHMQQPLVTSNLGSKVIKVLPLVLVIPSKCETVRRKLLRVHLLPK